jgi:hypothetical protein
MEATEWEQQADAAYCAQMAALRTVDWVGRTCGVESPVTPFGQIKSSEVGVTASMTLHLAGSVLSVP